MFSKIQALEEELFGEVNDEIVQLDDLEWIEMNEFAPNREIKDHDYLEKFATSIFFFGISQMCFKISPDFEIKTSS